MRRGSIADWAVERSAGPRRVAQRLLAVAAVILASAAPATPQAASSSTPPPPALPPPALPEPHQCPSPSTPLALGSVQWNGWGRDLENTRYQPEPALRATDVPKLALKWAFGYPGSAVAGQPTVVDGRLFVASATGRIYSLDAMTGCTYWTFAASAGVRTAIAIGEFAPPRAASAPKSTPRQRRKHGSRQSKQQPTLAHLDILKAPSAAFFGDDTGAVYALDAQKGSLLWRTVVDAHPLARIVGTPTFYHGKLYAAVASSEQSAAVNQAYACCTFRGSVAALDMTTGRVLWKTYTIPEEPPLAGRAVPVGPALGPAGADVSTSPSIDVKRNLLYVGTGGTLSGALQPFSDAVLALDLADGQVRWVKQFARSNKTGAANFMSSPILRTLADGKQVLLAGQASGIVYALDPDRGGDVLWQTKASDDATPAGIEWGPAADHRRLFVAVSGLVAEPDNLAGGIAAIDMKTGGKRWFTAAPRQACAWGPQACGHAQAQAVTVIPGVAFSGSMDAHLRAYSTIDGKILWDTDTAKEFPTVNGVKASGGSLDQGGATIVNGVVYINSGYGQRYGQPGNVLLAFSVDGK